MRRIKLHHVPGRIATGAYILHSGIGKLHADDATAEVLHGMAKNAFPPLSKLTPERFTRVLAISEITVGSLILIPFVPSGLAGVALTGFSGSLIAMYARTPSLRNPGSIWPSQAGIAVSKDVWMLGLALGWILDDITDRCQKD